MRGGAENDGAKKAAELAKVANYEILDLAEPAGVVAPTYFFFMTDADGITLPYPREAGVYLLYIPPLPVSQ